MACIFCTTPAWAQEDPEVYQPAVDVVGNYLDAIDIAEASGGAYSMELADLYLGLGKAMTENGEFEKAIEMYQQGMQVIRVNFGLNSPDQTNYLLAVADIENHLGNEKAVNQLLESAYLISARNYGEGQIGMLPVLDQLLAWYGVNRPTDVPDPRYIDIEGVALLTSKKAEILEKENGLGDFATTEIYRELGQITWLKSRYFLSKGYSAETGMELATGAGGQPTTMQSQKFSLKTLILEGDASFAKVAQSVGLDEDRTPQEHAEAIAQVGDWNLAFGRRQSASDYYLDAYNTLAAKTENTDLADEYFSLPTPVRFMQQDLEPISPPDDENAAVFARFSMTVTKGGRPLDIELLDAPDDIRKNNLHTLRRLVVEMRFRPRLSGGNVVETENYIWQIPLVKIQDPAESGQPLTEDQLLADNYAASEQLPVESSQLADEQLAVVEMKAEDSQLIQGEAAIEDELTVAESQQPTSDQAAGEELTVEDMHAVAGEPLPVEDEPLPTEPLIEEEQL